LFDSVFCMDFWFTSRLTGREKEVSMVGVLLFFARRRVIKVDDDECTGSSMHTTGRIG
jgi:hypothetical protein